MPAPIITSFNPLYSYDGQNVTLTGANFDSTPANNLVTINGVACLVISATTTQLVFTVSVGCTTGPITVTNGSGAGASSTPLQIIVGTNLTIASDTATFGTAEDNGSLSPAVLAPYLRAILKDTASDAVQVGTVLPTWSDAELARYLELARGEYTRQRPKKVHTIITTVANQQSYAAPPGSLGVDDVLWAPAGYDLDQISALAAALAGGTGLLWGGGVPVVGRVYFDSPASIQIWSTIREAWRKTFGGHWLKDADGFNLLPAPAETGLNVLVFYRTEQHWSDIPWTHRTFILANAALFAIEGLTFQLVASTTTQGSKLTVGLRALVQLIQQKYQDALNIREPGVTAGRS